jgi:hypothetical protein
MCYCLSSSLQSHSHSHLRPKAPPTAHGVGQTSLSFCVEEKKTHHMEKASEYRKQPVFLGEKTVALKKNSFAVGSGMEDAKQAL